MKDETVNRALDLVEKTGVSIHDAIGQLAASMGVAAEHVYGVLVRQQILSGWVTLGACVVGLVVLVALTCAAGLLYKKSADFDAQTADARLCCRDNPHTVPHVLSTIITAVFAIIYTSFAFPCGIDAVKMILNPEYYAIREAATFAGRILGN